MASTTTTFGPILTPDQVGTTLYGHSSSNPSRDKF